MKTIGITTTVPIEILLAAGYQPIDLNNVFITYTDRERLINNAEKVGLPINCCSWIKGIYSVCLEFGIDTVICVTSGDCSNNLMLMEVLQHNGLKVIPFAYPQQPDTARMQYHLETLAETLMTTLQDANRIRDELQPSRRLALRLDSLTWQQGLVSGAENHFWLVSTSDFNGDYKNYHNQLNKFLVGCKRRHHYPSDWLRLAYIGVPAIYGQELYSFLESNRARIVFNEVQRQFSMPRPGLSLSEQYCNYTYPYSLYKRLEDITNELKRRQVDGVIHYVQAFCHRGIGDIIFRDIIDQPILTLEGNNDFALTHHIKTRIEAFLDMLIRNRTKSAHFQQTLV
jgi:benzoyl-CoA reductase/2-hydroxyglutaryl-CoA dehydratase subunit BcrC/BadD/HgdB